VANNARHGVLRQGATGPTQLGVARKPAMGCIVLGVQRVEQRYQYIDIE